MMELPPSDKDGGDYYVTDCCCPNCGKRHKSWVDFNHKPPRVFGYYQTFCDVCRKMTDKQRAEYARKLCARLRVDRRGQRRK
jgi:hypothetical protein